MLIRNGQEMMNADYYDYFEYIKLDIMGLLHCILRDSQ